jgi:lipopolysaccharide/colanic/teichoic acid biosynthesis glycosyltransferase
MVPPPEALLADGPQHEVLPLAPPKRIRVPDIWPHAAPPAWDPATLLPGLHPAAAEFACGFADPVRPSVRLTAASTPEAVQAERGPVQVLVNSTAVNGMRRINAVFRAAHALLPRNGVLVVCLETLAQRRARIFGRLPAGVAHAYWACSFVLRRLIPKLPVTRGLYYRFSGGKRQVLSEAEALGRLYYCGFEVVETREVEGRLYVAARRTREPRKDVRSPSSPLFTMRRVGRGGEPVYVYKLRTMHPYSEFLQEYVYQRNALADGGKFSNDFRITGWGRLMRKLWVDELPMLINLLRGDLKLVGVRPLSEHYESLYPESLRQARRRVRPGLVPPFYADLPRTFDDIVASEARYLDAYERSPVRADVRYLCRAAYNILVRRARSS